MECKIIFQTAGLETLNEELVQAILGWVLPTQKSRWEAQVMCLVKDLMAHLKSDPPLLSPREDFAGVPDFSTNPLIHFPLLCHICPQIWWVIKCPFYHLATSLGPKPRWIPLGSPCGPHKAKVKVLGERLPYWRTCLLACSEHWQD